MAKKLELTPRLRMVADMLPDNVRLADVGTDHAYLPAALMLEGKIPFAIAADLREGPLSRARETVQEYGLSGKISFRLCDGLKGIKAEEVDAVSIAGMGGETIAMILEAAPWTREQNTALVLQPMSSMDELRAWLGRNGYTIREERLAREGDTVYTALLVGAGEMPPMTADEICAGKNTGDPLRGIWLEHWISRTARALKGMAQARQESVEQRRAELEQVLSGLEEMKKEWEAWQL